MRRMDIPLRDALDTFDACVAAVVDPIQREIYNSGRTNIQAANIAFENATQTALWANLPRAPHGNPDALIAGSITKKHLMDLYSDYMVRAKGASRDIYDEILTAAGGLCPFCGGLGHVGTLDHFLPKAVFPAYSVHPNNLVPCCRDCNSGKNSSFATIVNQQTLHPYLDHAFFFDERWITASVYHQEPILITYHCTPPGNWSVHDQERVKSHFKDYKLASRFSIQASAEVAKVVELRSSSLRILSSDGFKSFLLENANASGFVLNGWSRTMYQCLASSDWFTHMDFSDPNWRTPGGGAAVL